MSYDPITNTIGVGPKEDLFADSGVMFIHRLKKDVGHPNASEQIKCDWKLVEEWLDCGGRDLDARDHKTLARAWSAYGAMGVAPSFELQPSFDDYRSQNAGKPIEYPPPPQIIAVFDRILASDDKIRRKRAADAAPSGNPNVANSLRQNIIAKSTVQALQGARCAFCGTQRQKFSINLVIFAHKVELHQLSNFVCTSVSHGMVRGGLPICDNCAPPCKKCCMPLATRWTVSMIKRIRQTYPDRMIDLGSGYCRHTHLFHYFCGLFKRPVVPSVIGVAQEIDFKNNINGSSANSDNAEYSNLQIDKVTSSSGTKSGAIEQSVVQCFYYTQQELSRYYRGALVDTIPSSARHFSEMHGDYIEIVATKSAFMFMMLAITTSSDTSQISSFERDTRMMAIFRLTDLLKESMTAKFGDQQDYEGPEIDEAAVTQIVECEFLVNGTHRRLKNSMPFPFDPIFQKVSAELCLTTGDAAMRADILELGREPINGIPKALLI